jgi:hypothetical protein
LSNEEKTNDYENFEKGMIYMKILKKGGRRKRNPCPMHLWFHSLHSEFTCCNSVLTTTVESIYILDKKCGGKGVKI